MKIVKIIAEMLGALTHTHTHTQAFLKEGKEEQSSFFFSLFSRTGGYSDVTSGSEVLYDN